jgi:hypothetical protein
MFFHLNKFNIKKKNISEKPCYMKISIKPFVKKKEEEKVKIKMVCVLQKLAIFKIS